MKGSTGATGDTGSIGSTGDTEPTDPTGLAGTNGLSEYAYIYNLNAQVVALEADILFSTNGVIVGTIAHAPGSSTIQHNLEAPVTMQSGLMPQALNPANSLYFKMVLPLPVPYMAQKPAHNQTREWSLSQLRLPMF